MYLKYKKNKIKNKNKFNLKKIALSVKVDKLSLKDEIFDNI